MEQDSTLQHEDLLIRLRGKLNEEKIKLWEPPYAETDNTISQSLQDLAKKYSTELSISYDAALQALHELQIHSVDRSKANDVFKETGYATFRIRASVPGERPCVLKIQKKLSENGSELIHAVATEIKIEDSRVKLIVNGKVIKPTPSLEEQGVKNGAQIMALIVAANPEEVKKEDTMYMEMKSTRDDAMLLTECVDDIADEEELIKLEDQAGNTIELPPEERRNLLVGLALHERGRQAHRQKEYALALVLYLEADRMFSECSSAILKSVDNWALLQLDIAWCYLCLRALPSANDAAERLTRAERAFANSYGPQQERVIAIKGTAASERVLIMRLYLLQGIVAYHQNKRAEAKKLLEKAEAELNVLRVDENAVTTLIELGWSRGQARTGLRASGGDLDQAHLYLSGLKEKKEQAREQHRIERQMRILGRCLDGSPVSAKLVEDLIAMGYGRKLAILALRRGNNQPSEAVRLIQEYPDQLCDNEMSSDESTPSSEEVEPDNKLVAELEAMGYGNEEASAALRVTGNNIQDAAELLMAGGNLSDNQHDDGTSVAGHSAPNSHANGGTPSTSTSTGVPSKRKGLKNKKDKRRKQREQALDRLSYALDRNREDDDHLDSALVEEEEFLVQYKSLL